MGIENNSIILVNSSNKKRVLEYLCDSNTLLNRKIMNFNDFKKKLVFEYDEKTIYEIMKQEKVSYGLANLYLNNIYNIKEIDLSKIKYLSKIKKYLEQKNLIHINKLFNNSLLNKKVYLWNIPNLTKEDKNILADFYYEQKIIDLKEKEYSVYQADTLEDEVVFIADKVSELLKKGININKIKLMNLNDEYRLSINKIFKWYKIPTNIVVASNLYSTRLAQICIKEGIEKLFDYVENSSDEKIANKIIDIYNKYIFCDDETIKKEIIVSELKKDKTPTINLDKGIEEINIYSDIFDDEYIFILGFNQGVIPRIYKDEDYFSDNEKKVLGMSTSFELNQLEKKNIIYYLSKINNLIISYKKRSTTEIYYPSSLLDELNPNYIEHENKFNHSHLFNKIDLTKKLDNYYKFGTADTFLGHLYNNYKSIPYNTYDNSFTGIFNKKIDKYFKDKLVLSYTSIDNYFRCSFRYYLQSVLRLNSYEEKFSQQIGNLFHHVLAKAFLDSFNFDNEWNNYISDNNLGTSNKERFFLNKLKDELIFIIETINKQNDKSNLTEFFYEENLSLHPTNEENVTFMGIIDKLAFKKIDDRYICAIIDYKTGNPKLNLNYLPYGIDMQLPVYLYLSSHIDRLKPLDIAGFYLQKVLHTEINYDPKTTYENQKRKNLMLQGYSTNQENILEHFDSSYNDSQVIKSMKTGLKGFYSYSKVLSKESMLKIISLVDNNILTAIKRIKNGEFQVNPKKIGFDNVGCEYCNYKDICFMREKDIINLSEYKDFEFLGGDTDA
jgi:DNA replication factor Dna2.